jgi:hypothetical protein
MSRSDRRDDHDISQHIELRMRPGGRSEETKRLLLAAFIFEGDANP